MYKIKKELQKQKQDQALYGIPKANKNIYEMNKQSLKQDSDMKKILSYMKII